MKTPREYLKAGLPVHVFPKDVSSFIRDFAEGSGSQQSFVCAGVLACAAAMCDEHTLKVKSGYKEKSNFFLCIVGPAGTTKSAPIKAALKPLLAREAKENRRYKRELDLWKEKIKDKGLKKMERDALREAPPSRAPCKIVTDGSIEALIMHLEAMSDADKTAHAVFCKDEIKGFFGGMDKYKNKGGDEYELWLSLFSGADLVKTLVSKTIFVREARATVIGGIQPEVYASCMSDKGDGMIDRFMLAVHQGGPIATDIHSFCEDSVIKDYCDSMELLSDAKPMSLDLWAGDEREKVLSKVQEFHDWAHKIGVSHDVGAFKKWEQQFYRLIIIMVAMWDKKSVDLESVEQAAELAAFFASDWLTAKIMGDVSSEEKTRSRIKDWLKKSGAKSRRDIMRKFHLKKKDALDMLREMVEDGEISRINGPSEEERHAVYDVGGDL